jgi:long-chain acyl-CoA synthetase
VRLTPLQREDIMARTPATAAAAGMLSALYAEAKPDAIALFDEAGTRSFGALHARANRLARALRGLGLTLGDAIALMCGNRIEFIESFLAAMRIGLRITPVNWHLAQEEARYIVQNCEAKALICEAAFAPLFGDLPGLRRIAIDGAVGWLDYEAVLTAEVQDDPPDPTLGTIMLYTSGTTGRPKGVFRAAPEVIEPQGRGTFADYDPDTDVNLCPGPAYHAAPLLFDVRWPLASGVPIVLLRQWNSEAVLRAIDTRKVTHCHMAPIMFHRLLALPEEVRTRSSVKSLRRVFHGAAPCPVAVKHAMIEWFGPVLWEYYAASEGGAGVYITSEDWLRKPGSVGRRPSPEALKILREDGAEAATGEDGAISMKADPTNPFVYFKADDKTEAAHKDGYYTLGDVGRLDADDFLFLTGRTAECIISGGVNIYPQEVDDVVTLHPAVADACTIGAPNEEWGEEVRTCVELRPGHAPSPALAEDILAFVRRRLSGFKRPRGVDFVDSLPRLPSGKVQRGKVRSAYWQGRDKAI